MSVWRTGSLRGASASCGPEVPRTSTLAWVDKPMRNGCAASCRGSSATRTGTRCTTLIQLPVAFCAGSSAKAAPVPGPRPETRDRPLILAVAAVNVGHDFDRLADPHPVELHFLEVGFDSQALER